MPQDVLCFSQLRWDLVYQRPNHLMARAARTSRVFFVEEPIDDATEPRLELVDRDGVTVVIPHVRPAATAAVEHQLATLLDGLIARYAIRRPLLWYVTPTALGWTRRLHGSAAAVVYDCMDHLAGFLGAPPTLLQREAELLERADIVFTGGASLYEAKRALHPSVHCFPSSVDIAHFGSARRDQPDPADQAGIPHPRVGFFGVLDERIDWPLLEQASASRPDWQFILVGPVVKVDPASLPSAPNLHYLGPKPYAELPGYLAGWDVAMMPFARNEATRFISPTKTPEYLAGGRPVVSTSIRDVVTPYGDARVVHIADAPSDFVAAIGTALQSDLADLQRRADALLDGNSWDRTWTAMRQLVEAAVVARYRRMRSAAWPIRTDRVPVMAPTSLPAPAATRTSAAMVTASGEVVAAGRSLETAIGRAE